MAGDLDTRVVSAARLTELATVVLAGAGAPESTASAVAGSLVESNLLGHDSHGVRRLPSYLEAVAAGRVVPTAEPTVTESDVAQSGGATATIDGNLAFGQLSARLAVREVRERAHRHGVATAVIRRCNHVGRLGEYVAELAADGLVALTLGNADPAVAPYGGRERRLGTNPMAWGVPRADGGTVVMDWATAATAEGKLAEARTHGDRVAPGLLLDPSGRPSDDPEAFYAGGALLPFGGHKGYALSVIIEIVGGLLSGAGIGSRPGYDGGFGTVVVAVDIARFTPLDHFREEVEQFCHDLSTTALADGHDEVLVPGEREERVRRDRTEHGIPMTEAGWRELRRLLPPAT